MSAMKGEHRSNEQHRNTSNYMKKKNMQQECFGTGGNTRRGDERTQYRKQEQPSQKQPQGPEPEQEQEQREDGKATGDIDKSTPVPKEQVVRQIMSTITSLENYIRLDHQHDHKVRMALQRETQRVYDLSTTLAMERRRNQRLINLIGKLETSSSTSGEEDDFPLKVRKRKHKRNSGKKEGNGGNDQDKGDPSDNEEKALEILKSSDDEKSKPCSYGELITSYKQCRRQLNRKNRQLVHVRVQNEILQGRYENLHREYLDAHYRIEDICLRYLSMQKHKNLKIHQLNDALLVASECISLAQFLVACLSKQTSPTKPVVQRSIGEFNGQLKIFLNTLKDCDRLDCKCEDLANESKMHQKWPRDDNETRIEKTKNVEN